MTEAADFDEQIPKAVVQERFERLIELQEAISLERNRATVGRVEEVLVEGPSKKDPHRMSGRTRSNKLVHFAVPLDDRDDLGEGSRTTVSITAAHRHHLEGELVGGATRQATRSMSLPLLSSATAGCASCN
jgi:tRNA-2-methylthio-N6-dimethylallyladenosine synthase